MNNKLFFILCLFILTLVLVITPLGLSTPSSAEETISRGFLLEVVSPWDTIDSGVAECIISAIESAEQGNRILIIRVNSYGGYLDAAFDIGDKIYDSRIPVVAYVEKKALSAGTLIILPTDVIAMEKGAIIGAMQPVMVNPTTGEVTFVNESKILNPIIDKARVYAARKYRNITQVERFIILAETVNSTNAVLLGVADIEVLDFNEFINRIKGMEIKVGNRIYRVGDIIIEPYSCSVRSRFISILSNTYLSSLLISIGVLASIFAIVAGKLEVLPLAFGLLLLGLIGSGFNPNITSFFFVILGTILLAVELFITPGFGVIGVTGIVLITLGFMLLPMYIPTGIHPTEEYINMIRAFIFGVGIPLSLFTGIVMYKVIIVSKKKPILFTMVGKEGISVDDIKPGSIGYIKIEGEYWRASSSEEISAGERVLVLEMREDGVLVVKKKT